MTRRKDPQPDADSPSAEVAATIIPAVDPAHADPVVSDATSALDPGPDPKPQPQPELRPDLAPPPPRQSGLFGMVLGGALAAVGGFALSHYHVLGAPALDSAAGLTALSTRLDDALAQDAAALHALQGHLATLDARLAKLEAAPPPAVPDLSRLDALGARLTALESAPPGAPATDAALAAKVADLDRRLSAMPALAPSADIQKQLDEALTKLQAAEAAAQTRADEAEAAASASRRTQALNTLAAAIADGRPFAEDLTALADPALSATLQPFAETGVPTLAALQTAFPDPAREALRIARAASPQGGWSDRLVDFLAEQTGARSLTPQDGTTPDAILSRAEFALSEARVSDALSELGALDPAVKAPFDGWIALATAQVVATTALAAARGE